ncbi:ribonuclease HII [Acidocella sp.]|uniref:ribonuclease HII n=1 Tax=Acidocella sp. TaxID=50710 RepID=UPI002625DB51|nr:ribonuclease HII [Acidocella sp.]
MPDLSHERAIGGRVAGVDEAGRGPLAGPVLAAAVVLPARLPRGLAGLLDDSKVLSAKQRGAALAALRCSKAEIGIGAASVAEIGRINIFHASLLAMRRAIAALPAAPAHVLVDGNKTPGLAMPCTALVGGDGLSLSIAAASIVAKETRDALMRRLATRYPHYGWERNAGYAVEFHRAALLAHGPTPHHRPGFGMILREELPLLAGLLD